MGNSPCFEFFSQGENVSLRDGFGRALLALGKARDDFFLFDADVRGGTGARVFADAFPERVVQFGIAEQNMIGAAAGFADAGLLPVVVGFSSFTVMRAHEQLRTAVCYGRRKVLICCSHLGLDVGPDGATAQMLEDIATCRAIPTLKVVVPACANEIQRMLESIMNEPGPCYMRIGRSPCPILYENPGPIRVGHADVIRDGRDVSIIACGSRVSASLAAADRLADGGVLARVVNMRSIKPIDQDVIRNCCIETGAIVTVEDHTIYGGLGGAVSEVVVQTNLVPVNILGVKDVFGCSGEHYELFAKYGIDVPDIVNAAQNVIHRKTRKEDGGNS